MEEPSAINELVPIEKVQVFVENAWLWSVEHLFTVAVAAQILAILAAFVPAALFGPRLKRFLIAKVIALTPEGTLRSIVQAAALLALPIALYLCLTILNIGFASGGFQTHWISASLAIMNAWILVRLVTLVIKSPFWSRVAFFIAWPIAALDAFGALGPVIDQMQAFALPLGENEAGQQVTISLLDVIRTLFYFGLLFWGASVISSVAQQQLEKVDELSPSLKALIGKLLNIILPVVALLIALQLVGFNLATLAVFSGAVGLGLGLGLQRIVANFVAGFTLIADKSIKPKDTIEIDGTMGWVTAMQARYVALRTREGTELLIPNDRFMSEGVINWTRSDSVVRQHASFGITYSTQDLRAIQQIAVEAAQKVERVVENPPPICNLEALGDSSVNFDLCYWIKDPHNGLKNVRSDVLLQVWDALHEHNIEIPFPQRDLHIKSWPEGALVSQKTPAG